MQQPNPSTPATPASSFIVNHHIYGDAIYKLAIYGSMVSRCEMMDVMGFRTRRQWNNHIDMWSKNEGMKPLLALIKEFKGKQFVPKEMAEMIAKSIEGQQAKINYYSP